MTQTHPQPHAIRNTRAQNTAAHNPFAAALVRNQRFSRTKPRDQNTAASNQSATSLTQRQPVHDVQFPAQGSGTTQSQCTALFGSVGTPRLHLVRNDPVIDPETASGQIQLHLAAEQRRAQTSDRLRQARLQSQTQARDPPNRVGADNIGYQTTSNLEGFPILKTEMGNKGANLGGRHYPGGRGAGRGRGAHQRHNPPQWAHYGPGYQPWYPGIHNGYQQQWHQQPYMLQGHTSAPRPQAPFQPGAPSTAFQNHTQPYGYGRQALVPGVDEQEQTASLTALMVQTGGPETPRTVLFNSNSDAENAGRGSASANEGSVAAQTAEFVLR
jgi:hypothetical protein